MSALDGTLALVMAGGRGARMHASLGSRGRAKPLVPVRGVPLVERNVCALLGAGARELVVAVPASVPELGAHARGRLQALARAAGAHLEVLEEAEPLGTIGAARLVGSGARGLLVVNADNLTSLPLAELVAGHAAAAADLTVATHVHAFHLPYARVELAGARIAAYQEKPAVEVPVASALYVLGPRAIAVLPAGRCDAPDLVRRLLDAGGHVRAHAHRAPWIDVNDAAALAEAETLVAAHSDLFECWSPAPAVEVVGCLLLRGGEIALEERSAGARAYAGLWDTPGGKLEAGESPAAAIARELREELDLHAPVEPVVRFDDVDPSSGRVFRHHVFAARVTSELTPREGQRLAWWPRDRLSEGPRLSVAAIRSVAALGGP